MYYNMNDELCRRCGECANECYLNLENANRVDPTKHDCCGCGHCFMVCPFGAIEADDPQRCENEKQQRASVTPEGLLALLTGRRSHRRYTDSGISTEVIDGLIDAACIIPSGGNSHAYEFLVVRNNEIIESLKKEIMQVYKSKLIILKSRLLRTLVRPFLDRQTRALLKGKTYSDRIQYMLQRFNDGVDVVFYNAPVIIIIHSNALFPTPKEDAVLAGYNLNLYAETLGLGVCFVTMVQYAVNASAKCKKLLGLTGREHVHAALVLGQPVSGYSKAPVRHKKQAAYR